MLQLTTSICRSGICFQFMWCWCDHIAGNFSHLDYHPVAATRSKTVCHAIADAVLSATGNLVSIHCHHNFIIILILFYFFQEMQLQHFLCVHRSASVYCEVIKILKRRFWKEIQKKFRTEIKTHWEWPSVIKWWHL